MAAPPESPPAESQRVYVVSTVLHSIRFTEWLDYHFALGIHHFFLYFDAADDPNREVAARYKGRVTVRDCQAPGRPITAKQCAHVRHAVERAAVAGLQGWLLHIDDDELLHLGPGVSLPRLMGALPPEAYDLHFRNYEVCKTVPELGDYDFFSQEKYFYTKIRRSYRNGKSAGALRFAGAGLAPNGAHYFRLGRGPPKGAAEGKAEEEGVEDAEECAAAAGALLLPPKEKDPPGLVRAARDAACILHYPFIVYSRWRSKCSREDLSEWKVNWGFYRSCKGVISQWDAGEEALQQEFLRRCVVPPPEAERKLAQGDLVHIDTAADLIRRGRQLSSDVAG
eukprot:TRINITY_DN13530_c0_g1_i1.p1 TRINITY_DN13530_c0_g1~~TRINITY_DN13530_c0_g1_i1.p1  ORF type:complete len:364 (+),score=149.44 TRINITY_DN13530_c0_g1_i1:79-1092(+)